MPRPMYFLATLTTRRRLASAKWFCAVSPSALTRAKKPLNRISCVSRWRVKSSSFIPLLDIVHRGGVVELRHDFGRQQTGVQRKLLDELLGLVLRDIHRVFGEDHQLFRDVAVQHTAELIVVYDLFEGQFSWESAVLAQGIR